MLESSLQMLIYFAGINAKHTFENMIQCGWRDGGLDDGGMDGWTEGEMNG